MRWTSCKILGSNSCVYQLPHKTLKWVRSIALPIYIYIQHICSQWELHHTVYSLKSYWQIFAPCILFIAKANKVGQRIKQRNEREMLRSIFFTIHMRITLPRFKVKIGHANNLLESDYSTIFAWKGL